VSRDLGDCHVSHGLFLDLHNAASKIIGRERASVQPRVHARLGGLENV